MRDGAKARWIAWRFKKYELSFNEMPGMGAVVGDTLYHFGGSSWMPFGESVLVLKDYGTHTNDEFDDAGLWDKFYSDFPVESGTIEDLVCLSSGWIAPNGTIYPCQYGAHQALARRLVRQEKMIDDDESEMRLTLDQDTLIKARWMRICPVLFDWDNDRPTKLAVTKKQRERIDELSDAIDGASDDHRRLSDLRDSCDRALEDLEDG